MGVLNILIISLPCSIWAANSLFPCLYACFFASYISTEVLWKISTNAFISLIVFNGELSTKNLRNFGVPRRTMVGIMILFSMADKFAADLLSSVRIRAYGVDNTQTITA